MLILGIDSQFAYIEAVATVLSDLGIGERLPRCVLSGSRTDGGPLPKTQTAGSLKADFV